MVAKISKFGKKRGPVFEGAVMLGVFVVVLVAIIAFFLYGNITMAQRRATLEAKLRDLQAQALELQQRKETLEASAAGTQTEEYVERALREQGLYQKEGEQVVTILPPEEVSEEVVQKASKAEKTWWKPWTWF